MYDVIKPLGFTLPHILFDKSADNAEGGEADKGDADEGKKSGSDKTKTDKKSDSPENNDNSSDVLTAIETMSTALTEALTASFTSLGKTLNKDGKANRLANEKVLELLTEKPKADADEDPSALEAAQGDLAASEIVANNLTKTLRLEREARTLNFSSAEDAAKFALQLHPDKIKIEDDDDGNPQVIGAKEALEAVIETYPAMLTGAKKPPLDGEAQESNNADAVDREADIRSRMM